MLTMLLGGLWHGASWTFLVWGGLHGAFLVLNHGWNALGERARAAGRELALGAVPARLLTLLAVLVAWVFFAAPGMDAALAVLGGMLGAQGLASPHHAAALGALLRDGLPALAEHGIQPCALLPLGVLAVAGVTALFAPNSQQIVDGRRAGFTESRRWGRLRFRPGPAWRARRRRPAGCCWPCR